MSLAAIYITATEKDELIRIGKTLLEKRLVACVNISGSVTSMYWWKDEIETAEEHVMICKTQMRYVNQAVEMATELHSNEVPCITAFPVLKGNLDYFRWVKETTAQAEPDWMAMEAGDE